MKNRRYFTCPIQALYMIKEFGVKFILEDEEQLRSFLGVGLSEEKETFEEKLRIKSKYFIAKESEHIFEQKKGDIGIQQDNGYLAIAKAQEFEDFEENNGTISPSHYWKIIMRDNKHFFIGELENETQH